MPSLPTTYSTHHTLIKHPKWDTLGIVDIIQHPGHISGAVGGQRNAELVPVAALRIVLVQEELDVLGAQQSCDDLLFRAEDLDASGHVSDLR